MRITEEEYRAYLQRGVSLLRPAPPVSRSAEREADFQARVMKIAKAHGYLCYHTHDSRKSQEGFPDLVLTKPGRLLFLELKSTTKLDHDQETWLAVLGKSVPGVVAGCFYPEQYDEIVTLLTQTTAKEVPHA